MSTVKAYSGNAAVALIFAAMSTEVTAVARRLKEIRRQAGLSIRDVSDALGMANASTYQHYEDRYRRPLLPLEFVQKLAPIFVKAGASTGDLYALAGVDASGMHPLNAPGVEHTQLAPERSLKIEELDVRASAGAGLTGENERVIDSWYIPTGTIRSYSTAPANELRIITVIGDSMEPSLQPGQRVLVDTGDRRPSPPGIFVVWDGLGLVVKRVQILPHSEPARVKISSDNVKYDPYERTLDEAYIQGRVIGQWRWL
jgi:transcriptional regulator with XRE-family HTH domain